MLSNAYFLAKIRFDTAENEPVKNLQNFAKFANFAEPNPLTPAQTSISNAPASLSALGEVQSGGPEDFKPTKHQTSPLRPRRQRASVDKISAKCCSFSAVSAPIFARKYAFCSIFQNQPDYLAEIFEI